MGSAPPKAQPVGAYRGVGGERRRVTVWSGRGGQCSLQVSDNDCSAEVLSAGRWRLASIAVRCAFRFASRSGYRSGVSGHGARAPQRIGEDANSTTRRANVFDLACCDPVVDRSAANANDGTRLHDRESLAVHGVAVWGCRQTEQIRSGHAPIHTLYRLNMPILSRCCHKAWAGDRARQCDTRTDQEPRASR